MDDIKMDLKEIALEGEDWIHLLQDCGLWPALISTVMGLQVIS
jgi:hypothetical protein